jgi:quercetin dioxygenase-like cupin family protein
MAVRKSLYIWVLLGIFTIVAWFGFAAGIGTANAQQAAPTENKGISIAPLAAVDLGPEIPGMQGRQLRLRMLTIEPGGVLGLHSHKDRPGGAYVLKGTIIEHRGEVAKEHGVGDSWGEDGNVTHWVENKGTGEAVLIVTDIFKQP